MNDITPAPASDDRSNDPGVRLMRHPSGGAVIMLDPAAADALASFLGALPLAHDLVGDGYDSAGVDVVGAIRAMFSIAY